MSREITKLQFTVLYVSFSILTLAFKGIAHRGMAVTAPLWQGVVLLVILFISCLPWFSKLPNSTRLGVGWRQRK